MESEMFPKLQQMKDILDKTNKGRLPKHIGLVKSGHKVGIFHEANDITWLITALKSKLFKGVVKKVNGINISTCDGNVLEEEVAKFTCCIYLSSEIQWKGVISPLKRKLFLSTLAKSNLIVVIDDMEDSSDDEKDRILQRENKIRKHLNNLYLFTKQEKDFYYENIIAETLYSSQPMTIPAVPLPRRSSEQFGIADKDEAGKHRSAGKYMTYQPGRRSEANLYSPLHMTIAAPPQPRRWPEQFGTAGTYPFKFSNDPENFIIHDRYSQKTRGSLYFLEDDYNFGKDKILENHETNDYQPLGKSTNVYDTMEPHSALLSKSEKLVTEVDFYDPGRNQPQYRSTKSSKVDRYSQRLGNVGIFSRSAAMDYAWLETLLRSRKLEDHVKDVKSIYLGNKRYLDIAKEVTFGILYHTKNRGTITLTDDVNALYDEELKDLSETLGRNNVLVVIDDLEDSSYSEKMMFLATQPSIRKFARDLLLVSEKEKRVENLEEKLRDALLSTDGDSKIYEVSDMLEDTFNETEDSEDEHIYDVCAGDGFRMEDLEFTKKVSNIQLSSKEHGRRERNINSEERYVEYKSRYCEDR